MYDHVFSPCFEEILSLPLVLFIISLFIPSTFVGFFFLSPSHCASISRSLLNLHYYSSFFSPPIQISFAPHSFFFDLGAGACKTHLVILEGFFSFFFSLSLGGVV